MVIGTDRWSDEPKVTSEGNHAGFLDDPIDGNARNV